jgi:hypothetical protein
MNKTMTQRLPAMSEPSTSLQQVLETHHVRTLVRTFLRLYEEASLG